MALTKDKKFVLISAPIVLAILGFMIYSESGPSSPEVEQVDVEQKHAINDKNELLSKLDEPSDGVYDALSKDSRLENYKQEKEKYSMNDDDHHTEQDIWESLYSSNNEESAKSESEVKEVSEPVREESKTKIVYRDRPTKKSTSVSSKTTTTKQTVSTSTTTQAVEEPTFKRRTAINSSYSGGDATQSNEYIHAVIHNKQEIHNGGEVRIRTTEECIINNKVVPQNTYMNGVSSFINDRVQIKIGSFELNGKIEYTNLIVYDKGSTGVYIPGGINQEIVKETTTSAINNRTTINIPIVGGSISSGGGKKVNDKTIILPEGYKLMLKQEEKR